MAYLCKLLTSRNMNNPEGLCRKTLIRQLWFVKKLDYICGTKIVKNRRLSNYVLKLYL